MNYTKEERLYWLGKLIDRGHSKVRVNGDIITVIFANGKAQIDGLRGNLVSWVFPDGVR